MWPKTVLLPHESAKRTDTITNDSWLGNESVAAWKKRELNGNFAFNDCNTYQDFITAIDYCGEKFPAAFMAHENDIFAMYVTIDTSNYPKEKLNELRRKGKFDY